MTTVKTWKKKIAAAAAVLMLACMGSAVCLAAEKGSDNMENYKVSDKKQFETINVFGTGSPNTGYAKYFIGSSFLNPLTGKNDPLPMSNVTFEPGCRNNWHIHHAETGGGQVLICTAGEGWYQEWGKEPIKLKPGMVVEIPANVKHWHGAAADSWFSHIAFEIPGTKTSNEWLEEVHDPKLYKD